MSMSVGSVGSGTSLAQEFAALRQAEAAANAASTATPAAGVRGATPTSGQTTPTTGSTPPVQPHHHHHHHGGGGLGATSADSSESTAQSLAALFGPTDQNGQGTSTGPTVGSSTDPMTALLNSLANPSAGSNLDQGL